MSLPLEMSLVTNRLMWPYRELVFSIMATYFSIMYLIILIYFSLLCVYNAYIYVFCVFINVVIDVYNALIIPAIGFNLSNVCNSYDLLLVRRSVNYLILPLLIFMNLDFKLFILRASICHYAPMLKLTDVMMLLGMRYIHNNG